MIVNAVRSPNLDMVSGMLPVFTIMSITGCPTICLPYSGGDCLRRIGTSIIVCSEDPETMDNDSLHILRVLFQERGIDAYQLHVATKIPPSTLYTVLESNRKEGRVIRNGLVYSLTPAGEKYLASFLEKELIRPSVSFKSVPEQYAGAKASKDDVSVLNDIQ